MVKFTSTLVIGTEKYYFLLTNQSISMWLDKLEEHFAVEPQRITAKGSVKLNQCPSKRYHHHCCMFCISVLGRVSVS